jgi:site-specific DNA recombinase
MFAWYGDEGGSLCGLAKKLQRDGVPSPRLRGRWNLATLHGILTNPVSTGLVYAGRLRCVGNPTGPGAARHRLIRPREDWIAVATVPAILTQEQFDRVQDKLAQNRQFAGRHNTAHPYLLRALVSCGVCGLSCLGRGLPSGHRYYCCRGKLPAVYSCRDSKCPARFIPAAALDDVVWRDVCRLLAEPEQIRRALERALGGHWLPQELQARCESLRRGQASLRQQIERLTEAYLAGVVGLEEYRRRRGGLEQQAAGLEAQRRQLEAQVDRQAETTRLALSMEAFCQRVRQGLEQATWEQKRQLIECLVARVIVTNGEVEMNRTEFAGGSHS